MKKHFPISEEKIPNSQSLTILTDKEHILSKSQKTFNRLIKKIEILQNKLQENSKLLDEHLKNYSKIIHPLEIRLSNSLNKFIIIFYDFYRVEKNKDRIRWMGFILEDHLREYYYFNQDNPDEKINEIYKAAHGLSVEEMKKHELNEMADALEDIFRTNGYDVNLKDIDFNNPEEVAKRMQEEEEKMRRWIEEDDHHEQTRKKTKKELLKEQREKLNEEIRKKNITSIYRQLAKILHPDLEQDPEIKKRKEVLMKELTGAYENNDIHMLLKLEMEWIYGQNNKLISLAEEKLAAFNIVLKEQVEELEDEISDMIYHPQYKVLQRYIAFEDSLRSFNFNADKRTIEEIIETMGKSIEKLKSSECNREIYDLIAKAKRRERELPF